MSLRVGSKDDPIAEYARFAGSFVLSQTMRAPVAQRKQVVKTVLDKVDNTLWATVSSKAAAFEKQGMTAIAALERALQISFANGMLKALSNPGSPQAAGYYTVGGLWGDVKGGVKKVGRGVKKGAKKTWKATKKAAAKAGDIVEDIGEGLKDAGCWLANQPFAPMLANAALQAGEAYAGIPPDPTVNSINKAAVNAGIGAAKAACNKAGPPPPVLPPPPVVVPSKKAETYTAPPPAKASSTPLLAGGLLAALLLL